MVKIIDKCARKAFAVLLLLSSSALLAATSITITPPSRYTDGSLLTLGEIARYEICFLTAITDQNCLELRTTTDVVITSIPTTAKAAKGRVVTSLGGVSDWSVTIPVAVSVKIPVAPVIQFNYRPDPMGIAWQP